MQKQSIPYDKQIFVCTNNMKGEKASCCDNKGDEIFRQLRQLAKDKGLHPRIRIAQATCLGQCANGVNIMFDDVWYSGVRLEDVPELAKEFFSDLS